MATISKSYKELSSLQTFEERYEYLKLTKAVGVPTFGFHRYLNQNFYRSSEWKHIRNQVLIRDCGCDLGIEDRRIFSKPIIHHINPITIEDIESGTNCIFNLNNLICTSHTTHNAIHFGDTSLLQNLPKERTKGDTNLWTASSHL
jgi:hypothetical protein